MNKTPLAGVISSIVTASAFFTTPLVFSQDQDTSEEFDEDVALAEEVLVTGSRIRKDVFTSSTPLDIIDVGEASVQGIANVGALLQSSTAAMGSAQLNSTISFERTESIKGSDSGGLGANTISLRGLGANRTLVLLNGRRAGPSGIQGRTSSFDLNILPLATIDRVEVLKDGASSIYGSDAVAGVINIITKKEDGATFDVFTSVPGDSGGEQYRATASWGKAFERGNFRVTASYNRQEMLRQGDRDYFDCGNQLIFDQTTGERADIVDPRTGEFHCSDQLPWGHIWIYDYSEDSNIPNDGGSLLAQYDHDGVLGQHIPGYAAPTNASQLTAPAGWFPVGYDRLSDGVQDDDSVFQDRQSLIPETELFTLYAEGEYDLTDDLTVYGEVLFNRRKTFADSYKQGWSYVYSGDFGYAEDGSLTDPTGGSELTAEAGWFGQQWFSPLYITDKFDSSAEIDYIRFVAGLRGKFAADWEWDLSFQYSNSDGSYWNQRIFADSIFDNNWATSSCVGTFSSVRGAPCVDVPWFDPAFVRGEMSPEVDAFLHGEETGYTKYTQWSVDGFTTGNLFDMPAGPVGIAVGFHYREDELSDTPGWITFDPETGEGNVFDDAFAGITHGKDKTYAFFGEIDVPLLADKPLVENLTLNASARFNDVDSYGTGTTWKVGLNWQVTDSFRLRANRGTSFRAPALFELFLADATSTVAQSADPCRRYEANFQNGLISSNTHANCAADPANLPPDYAGGTVESRVFTGGGFGVLEAETSDSFTVGFVWQPDFADLSISVDYFDIDLKDEVDQLGGRQILRSCYDSDFGFAFSNTEPLCDLFDRSALVQGPDNIMDSFINIASQRNRGFDFQARYHTALPWGDLLVEVDANHQVEDFFALFEETSEDRNGLVGEPKWVGATSITFMRDSWSLYWNARYVGKSSNEEKFGADFITYRQENFDAILGTPVVWYHNVSASYQMDNGFMILAGVSNVFDKNPPQLTFAGQIDFDTYTMVGNSVIVNQYDMYGRSFFLNVTKNFN